MKKDCKLYHKCACDKKFYKNQDCIRSLIIITGIATIILQLFRLWLILHENEEMD